MAGTASGDGHHRQSRDVWSCVVWYRGGCLERVCDGPHIVRYWPSEEVMGSGDRVGDRRAVPEVKQTSSWTLLCHASGPLFGERGQCGWGGQDGADETHARPLRVGAHHLYVYRPLALSPVFLVVMEIGAPSDDASSEHLDRTLAGWGCRRPVSSSHSPAHSRNFEMAWTEELTMCSEEVNTWALFRLGNDPLLSCIRRTRHPSC